MFKIHFSLEMLKAKIFTWALKSQIMLNVSELTQKIIFSDFWFTSIYNKTQNMNYSNINHSVRISKSI